MSDDKKPLFPRKSESDAEAQSNLLKDVKQKLEAAERGSEFELPKLKKKRFMTPMESHKPLPPAPAYGPPPFFSAKAIFVYILAGSLLALFAIYMIVKVLFVR